MVVGLDFRYSCSLLCWLPVMDIHTHVYITYSKGHREASFHPSVLYIHIWLPDNSFHQHMNFVP